MTELWSIEVLALGIQHFSNPSFQGRRGFQMDAGTAKKLIEKNLAYDEVKRLTVKLVQHASPQTELLETEPQVLALILDVIKPELEQSGLKPVIDRMGNLILHVKGRGRSDRLILSVMPCARRRARCKIPTPARWSTAHHISLTANAFGDGAPANRRAAWRR
jgi:hypothetical protein